jgi:hypothetical protein
MNKEQEKIKRERKILTLNHNTMDEFQRNQINQQFQQNFEKKEEIFFINFFIVT